MLNVAGWLTTVVSRISLDVLRWRQARPEASYDDGLSELARRSGPRAPMAAAPAERPVATTEDAPVILRPP